VYSASAVTVRMGLIGSQSRYNSTRATATLSMLKLSVVEVSVTEHLTIDQFEHTKLIGENITFGINPIPVEVCCRTIVAAQEEAVVFDRLHQCPQTQQVRITINETLRNINADTNAGIDLLLDLCCFLISCKLTHCRHLTGKVANFLYISERRLTVHNVCIRFHKQAVIGALQIHRERNCPTVTKISICLITSVRSNDNLLVNYLWELVSEKVGVVFIKSTKPDKISLQNGVCIRKAIITSVQNLCNFASIELIDLFMVVGNANLLFVEYCFGANKERISSRINPPHNSRGTVNLHAQMSTSSEPVQHGEVTRQDGVFGVFEVGVLHVGSIGCLGVLWGFGGQSTNWHKVGCFAPLRSYTKVTSEGGAG